MKLPMKIQPAFRRWMAFLLPLFYLGFAISGCNGTLDETWRCYDTSGNPVGGVLVICSYGMPSCDKSAVNFRFADATGKLVLDLDNDNPNRGLRRAYVCIYSRQLRNGGGELGERWHEGEPVPTGPVYFDEWNNKIHIAPGGDNPRAWHASLDILITSYSMKKDPVGGPRLGKELHPFIARQRQEFLEKYGDTPVPPEYLKTVGFRLYHKNLAALPPENLKFKDITLELSKP